MASSLRVVSDEICRLFELQVTTYRHKNPTVAATEYKSWPGPLLGRELSINIITISSIYNKLHRQTCEPLIAEKLFCLSVGKAEATLTNGWRKSC